MPTTTFALINTNSIVIATDGISGIKYIHSLSDKYPIGIVVEYNNNGFYEIQWADIIKKYRDEYGNTSKEIEDWADSFLEFLAKNIHNKAESRKMMFKNTLFASFHVINNLLCYTVLDPDNNHNILFKNNLEAFIEAWDLISLRTKPIINNYTYNEMLDEFDDEIMDYIHQMFDMNGISKEYIFQFLHVYYLDFIFQQFKYTLGNTNLHFFGWGQDKNEFYDETPSVYTINLDGKMKERTKSLCRMRLGFLKEDFSYLDSTPYKIFHRLIYMSQWHQNDCVEHINNKVFNINNNIEYSKRYQKDLKRTFCIPLKRNYLHTKKNQDYEFFNIHTPSRIKGQVNIVKDFMNIALSDLPKMENKMVEIAFIDLKKGFKHL